MAPTTPHRRSVAAGALAAAALSFCLAAAPALAQAPVPTVVRPVGTEVRIFAPRVQEGAPLASPWFSGRLVDADTAGVTVQTSSGQTVAIPRSFVVEFAVRAGPVNPRRSIVQGALAGAALGLVGGRVSTPPESGATGEAGRHLRNGALVGVLVGAAFGAFNPWHRWDQAPLPTATSAAAPN